MMGESHSKADEPLWGDSEQQGIGNIADGMRKGLCAVRFARFALRISGYEVKHIISISKLASYSLLTYHNYYEKHPCKTWLVPIFRCLDINTIYLM